MTRNRKAELTPHQERLTTEFDITMEEWEKKYKYIKKHSIATKKRDFLYMWLCAGPYTNSRYVHFGVKPDAKCQYCNHDKQDFRHLFQECKEVNELRERLSARWRVAPNMKEWLMGTENNTQEEKALTYICLELNHYIQFTNWKGSDLSLADFKKNLRSTEFLERIIAQKKNRMETHDEKWRKIFNLLG